MSNFCDSRKHQASAGPEKRQRGIALLESLIAILIFSIGILGIVGLQGVMIKGTSEAKTRSDASLIAQRRVSMMWAAPAALAGFAEVDTVVPELPNGLRTTAVTMVGTDATVTVTITWQAPGEPVHNYVTNARISEAI